ncbi:MAG TPA: hypothetical protein VFS15_29320 [Kofleriaceae bacterium]|nr:hypothetical protein [Kofleriaceae bacterium]
MADTAQPIGSSRALLLLALPIATLGCASGASRGLASDAAPADAAEVADAAPADVAEVIADAPPDAGCAISEGAELPLDGMDDLAKYPADQQLTPGAALGADQAALAWTRDALFVTVSSAAFTAPYEPLHIYVETGAALATPVAAMGKEYSGLTPAVPFTPTYLIAVRRVSDAGTGPYDGVFVPADSWQTRTLALDDTTFVAPDQQAISVRVPWSALGGCPTAMRLALHVVHAQPANEWKDLVPATHTPWQMPGGGYYEIDLTGPQSNTSWALR